jgi:Icc-related predicted phosphoesterase
MRIVAISDTHERHRLLAIPEGDVLVHAGDITMKGSLESISDFAAWMKVLPHKHKVVVAGNHDFCFENEQRSVVETLMKESGITYLFDSGVVIDGVHFWGSPWQPWFYDWAFNLARGAEIAEKWALIPTNTQVLITHGPPHAIADLTIDGIRAGCEELTARIEQLPALKLHIFGHIHEGYGIFKQGGATFANASICDERYRPTHAPLVIDFPGT